MAFLLQWVKKLSVFMILSGYMEHLLPKMYRQYFHMCIGLLLILMMSGPLHYILKTIPNIDFTYLLKDLKINSVDGEFDDEVQRYYIGQYKDAMDSEIRQLITKQGFEIIEMNFKIDEDTKSETYGKIQHLSVVVKSVNDEGDISGLRDRLKKELSLSEEEMYVQLE